MHRMILAAAAAALTLAAPLAAEAASARCMSSASGKDWRSTVETAFVDGQRWSTFMRLDVWAEAPFPGEDSDYGYNILQGRTEDPVGWVTVMLGDSAGTRMAMVDVVGPQMFSPGAVMMGQGDGSFAAALRLVVDGQAATTRKAMLVGTDERFPTSAANNFMVRVGSVDKVAGDNAEAMGLAARVSRAAAVRVETLDPKGAPIVGFDLRSGAFAEALAAREGLHRQVAADFAAGKCAAL
jgi:hypothetical protein